ncbi:hypothetical protein P7K49_004246 [Saguinus oedipus]|uniref:Uncharacterized protein n=1 Tax=Saguinus oedipus TaxID=9490 RepID=A0ABQ9W7H1_SAGOE|nr:hypothetical protein P7K49_004246 [Saguinus oedipus]
MKQRKRYHCPFSDEPTEAKKEQVTRPQQLKLRCKLRMMLWVRKSQLTMHLFSTCHKLGRQGLQELICTKRRTARTHSTQSEREREDSLQFVMPRHSSPKTVDASSQYENFLL